jgi:hypothetical protein
MRYTVLALLFGLTASLAGCGSSSEVLPASSHQGKLFALPDRKGFFEIRTEGGTTTGRGSRSKAAANSLIVYFYQPDGTTEISPAPTDVTVTIGAGSTGPAVALAPQPKGGFASPPGHFPFASGFRGQLNAKINGETIETTFVVR